MFLTFFGGFNMRRLLFVVLSYLVSNPANAEVLDRTILSFGMGASYPIAVGAPDIFSEEWNSGVHIGGSLGYILDKGQKFIVSSSVDYTNYILALSEGTIVRADQSVDVVSVFTDLKMRLRSSSALVIPYVKGGLGLFRSVREDRVRDTLDKQNKMGFGVDAGVDLAVSGRAGFFAEAQYQVGLTEIKTTQHMPFKVGFFFR
jgi:hypothetical protein